jgi:hydrogenase-4 component F
MLAAILIVPAVATLLAWWQPRVLLVRIASLAQLALVIAAWRVPPRPLFGGYLALDAPGLLILSLTSLLFAGVSVYVGGYLERAEKRPLRVFIAALLGLQTAVTLVSCAQHFGLFWVAIETSTLASAPLLFFHHSGRALEATWKYLIVGSVGIALALLGTVFLAVAATDVHGETTLFIADLAGRALSKPWLHASFVLLLIGYGTKMGLAPMHAWKPDAYGEAPPPVAGLLAGCITSVAFLGVMRITSISVHAGEAHFASSLLILLGLVSMGVAALFIIGQSDYRRLLAYSSVEHMGILVFGLGFGLLGAQGALLHMLSNALAKGVLFLVAGNILQVCGTSAMGSVVGLLRRAPATGVLLIVGLFAALGLPPFGLFISEFTILRAALSGTSAWPVALYLGFLAIIFLGMCAAVLPMAQGDSSEKLADEPWTTTVPPAVFAAAVLVLGVYIPAPIAQVIRAATLQLGAG